MDVEYLEKMMEEMANTPTSEPLPPNTGWPHGFEWDEEKQDWVDWKGRTRKELKE